VNLKGLELGRNAIIAIVLVAVALAANALLLNALSDTEETLSSLQATYDEMLAQRDEYLALKGKLDSKEGKMHLAGIKGIVHAVDEIFEPLGLKGKVKSVKTLPAGPRDKDIREETAEVTVQGATMNEMVNIFYSIENSPMLLLIRKVNIKQSFENPELLSLTMTISFIKP
jgi:hypothetical protein